VRFLYESDVETMDLQSGVRRRVTVQLAASGLDDAVGLINTWARDQGLEPTLHGALTPLRKARRQEPRGVQTINWAE
jgi:hypothetical protein